MDNKDIYQIFKKNPSIAKHFIELNKKKSLNNSILKEINNLLINHKHALKNKNFNIKNYNSSEKIYDAISDTIIDEKINTFLKKETSNQTRNLLNKRTHKLLKESLEWNISLDVISDNIFNKISRYKTVGGFNSSLKRFIESQKNNNIRFLFNKVNNAPYLNTTIKEIDFDNQRMIISINDFETCQKLGSQAWCIATSESYWNDYIQASERNDILFNYLKKSKQLKNEYNNKFFHLFSSSVSQYKSGSQFIIYNLNDTYIDKEQMIGITIDKNRDISAAHYKDDSILDIKEIYKYISFEALEKIKHKKEFNIIEELVLFYKNNQNNFSSFQNKDTIQQSQQNQKQFLWEQFLQIGILENPVYFKKVLDNYFDKYSKQDLLKTSLYIVENKKLLKNLKNISEQFDFIKKYFPTQISEFYQNFKKDLFKIDDHQINFLSKKDILSLCEYCDLDKESKETLLVKHFISKTSFKTLINESEYRNALENHIKLYGNPFNNVQKSKLLSDCQEKPILDKWYKQIFSSFSLEMLKNQSTFDYLQSLNKSSEIDYFVDNLIIDSKTPSPKILNNIVKLVNKKNGYLSKELFKKIYNKHPDIFFTNLVAYKKYNDFFADMVIDNAQEFNYLTHKKSIHSKINNNILQWLKKSPDGLIKLLKDKKLDDLFQEILNEEYPGLHAINNVSSSLNKKPSKKMKP